MRRADLVLSASAKLALARAAAAAVRAGIVGFSVDDKGRIRAEMKENDARS